MPDNNHNQRKQLTAEKRLRIKPRTRLIGLETATGGS